MVGENGIGKKSFINTLCEEQVFLISDCYKSDASFKINTEEVIIKKEFPIRMTVHLTENFGHNLNNTCNFDQIIEFLDDKLDLKLLQESQISRIGTKRDEVVHLVILFVNPLVKGLKPIEIELIKSLENKCNLLLCIGKCDILNYDQLKLQKDLINKSLIDNDLKVFDFEVFLSDPEIDEEFKQYYSDLKQLLPFSVITSNDNLFNNRITLKHSINVNEYSDVNILRDLIFNLNLNEFKELTNYNIYETYRTEKLLDIT